MNVRVFTLWASMKGEEPAPWMIAAEDEFSWEANGDRCDRVFADAKALAERNGWDVREITLVVNGDVIYGEFEPLEVQVEVES